jgi:hypothetical protein
MDALGQAKACLLHHVLKRIFNLFLKKLLE